MLRRFAQFVLLIATCCAASNAWSAYDMGPLPGCITHTCRYMHERGMDFLDIFRAQMLVPEKAASAGIRARATVVAQAGAAHFDGRTMGMDRRETGVARERRDEGGLSVLYYSSMQSKPQPDCCPTGEPHFDPTFRHHNGWDDGRNRPLSFSAMLQLPALPGFDVGFYPEEAADFVFGFFGLDVLSDDHPAKPAPAPRLTMPGEERIQQQQDFMFQKSYDEDLKPFTHAESPNVKIKKAD